MKKTIFLILFALAFSVGLVSALSAVSHIPNPGNKGTASELVSVTADTNLTSAFYSLDGGAFNSLTSCVGTTCSLNVDMSGLAEGNHTMQYMISNGTLQPTPIYIFYIDRTAPTQVIGLNTTSGPSDNEITLAWSASTDSISGVNHYNIFRNTTNIANTTLLNYVDTVAVGNWSYQVSAVDNLGWEGVQSVAVFGESKSNPPANPTINATQCVKNQGFPCYIKVTYTKNVTLLITSGGYQRSWATLSNNFDWYPPVDLTQDITYFFELNATDFGGLKNSYNYPLVIGNGSAVPISINGGPVYISLAGYGVKNNAVNTGSDWVVLGWDLSMNGGTTVRLKMTDLVGPSTIQINESVQPIAFCAIDYNSTVQDIKTSPTYNTYNVDNNYNELVSALNCPDANPLISGSQYSVYLKIPIPANTTLGAYSSTVNFGLYT